MELMTKIAGLYEHSPQAEYSMHEAANMLKATYSHLYKTVKNMTAEGVLACKTKGKANMCRLNIENDKARALLALHSLSQRDEFYKKNKLMAELLNEFVRGIEDDNIYSVVLFGSYASGKAKEASDIDLLVLCASKAKSDKKVHAQANSTEARYGKEVNTLVLDKAMFARALKTKENNAVKEAISNHVILSGFEMFWKFVAEALE